MNGIRHAVPIAFAAMVAVFGLMRNASAQPNLPPPEDVEYWICNHTGKKLEWGAVGVIIDQWDTRAHGSYHDRLIWYHYRYLYPDGRTYSDGYDWVDRQRPDPTVKPGSWAIHNWPVRSPESLIPLELIAVRRAAAPHQPDGPVNPALALERPPTPPVRPETRVIEYPRWHPPPPTYRYVVVHRPYRLYTTYHVSYSAFHRPYFHSRVTYTARSYVVVGYSWRNYWAHYQYQTAMFNASSRHLREQYRHTFEQEQPPVVDYVDSLRAKIPDLDRFTGSFVDRFSADVKADARDVFATLPATAHIDEQTARLPTNFMQNLPTPDLAAVKAIQGIDDPTYSEEVAANLARQMQPLAGTSALPEIADVAMLDSRLELWTGMGGWERKGIDSAMTPQLVSQAVMIGDEDAEVASIERAVTLMESNTGFTTLGDGGLLRMPARGPAVSEATFALTSSGELRAAIRREYATNPQSVNLAALVPADDDSDDIVMVDTAPITSRRVNLDGRQWHPLPRLFAEATNRAAGEALFAPPSLRAQAFELWNAYQIARSRNR